MGSKEGMQVKIEPLSSAQAKVKVSLPPQFVSEKLDSYYAGLAKKAKVPGFRPGKAPKDVVRKMYAQDATNDLTERLVSEAVVHVVQDHKLELIMPPRLVATDLPVEGKEFNFEIEVDLRPSVPAIEFKGVQVEETESTEVKDEDINAQLELLRDADATFADVTPVRPAKNGDVAVVKFTGTVDGKTAPELQSESSSIAIGEKKFLPEFENALPGLTPGQKANVKVNFPENYHAPDYRGKVAEFEIELLQLKEKVLPALDDTFAKAINSNINTLDELKADIRKELEEQKERLQKSKLRDAVGDKLVEKYPIEVSPRQVENLAERLAQEAHHMMHQMGVEHEESEDHMQALHASSLKKARRDIQLSYILQRISQDQKFEITGEDLEKRFKETSKKTGYSVAQIKQYYSGKDEDSSVSRIDRLKIDIQDEKSLDYALSQVTIKKKGS